MIGFILLIVLTIGAWVLFHYGDKHDKETPGMLGIMLGLIFTTLTVVSTGWLVVRNADASDFRKDRDYRQELVNSVSDNMSPTTIANIFSSAEYVNAKIEKNKKHCNSAIWGFMYSKEIAEIEPIEIPKYKISIEVEE